MISFLQQSDYPLMDLVRRLRKVILSADASIGEGIHWNAPAFFYTGEMKPFDPKQYRRFIVGFNFFRKDELRLIFLRGADADDPKGLLTGDFKDRRKLMSFSNVDELKKVERDLVNIVRDLVKKIED